MSANNLNINEASKACGLSPSVLRIWELRYGWPNPKRKPNGYRAYNQHQIQELKRVADLVKRGTPISALIIDGLPRWPTDQAIKRSPLGLTKSRALEKPAGVLEASFRKSSSRPWSSATLVMSRNCCNAPSGPYVLPMRCSPPSCRP